MLLWNLDYPVPQLDKLMVGVGNRTERIISRGHTPPRMPGKRVIPFFQ